MLRICAAFFYRLYTSTNMSRYKNVFIDLDDTLYDFKGASLESFKETYNLLGYDRYFHSFEQYIELYTPRNLQLWEQYGRGEITKSELNRIRYSYPLEVVGVHDEQLASQFCKEALSRIPTKNTHSLMPVSPCSSSVTSVEPLE